MRITALSIALAAGMMMTSSANAADTVLLHAAGSLREALTGVARSFEAATFTVEAVG
jgi:molybdate transport system substrate-binding protein